MPEGHLLSRWSRDVIIAPGDDPLLLEWHQKIVTICDNWQLDWSSRGEYIQPYHHLHQWATPISWVSQWNMVRLQQAAVDQSNCSMTIPQTTLTTTISVFTLWFLDVMVLISATLMISWYHSNTFPSSPNPHCQRSFVLLIIIKLFFVNVIDKLPICMFLPPSSNDHPLTNNPSNIRNSGQISFSAVVCHEYSFFFFFHHSLYSSDYFLLMSFSHLLLCVLIVSIICTAFVTMYHSHCSLYVPYCLPSPSYLIVPFS